MKMLIIGAGGASQWILRAMAKSPGVFPIDTIDLVDRDIVEAKNLDRQTFNRTDVGKNKAEILANSRELKSLKHLIKPIPKWFDSDMMESYINNNRETLLIVSATDNFPARTLALDLVDRRFKDASMLFSPGNGYDTEEAYVYLSSWKDNALQDPRVRFPEHLTDKTDDPLSPPCDDEESLQSIPQLALANMGGALLCLKLMYFWINKVPDLLDMADASLQDQLKKTFPFRYHAGAGFIKQENCEGQI